MPITNKKNQNNETIISLLSNIDFTAMLFKCPILGATLD